jgi:hypothetical protein
MNKQEYDISVKRISDIDIYNEKDIFEDLMYFLKHNISKKYRKIVVIDDFNDFTEMFKKKINMYNLSHPDKVLYIYVNSYFQKNNYNKFETIQCPLISKNEIIDFLERINCNTYIKDTLVSKFENDGNIRMLLETYKLTNFIENNTEDDTEDDTETIHQESMYGRYIYSDTFEYNYMRKLIIEFITNTSVENKKELSKVIIQKYNNNENIKDVILLIEKILLNFEIQQYSPDISSDMFIKESNKKCVLLELCNNIKKELLLLKTSNKYINYKILFQYFILHLKKII